jgi:hypothetical protein
MLGLPLKTNDTVARTSRRIPMTMAMTGMFMPAKVAARLHKAIP